MEFGSSRDSADSTVEFGTGENNVVNSGDDLYSFEAEDDEDIWAQEASHLPDLVDLGNAEASMHSEMGSPLSAGSALINFSSFPLANSIEEGESSRPAVDVIGELGVEGEVDAVNTNPVTAQPLFANCGVVHMSFPGYIQQPAMVPAGLLQQNRCCYGGSASDAGDAMSMFQISVAIPSSGHPQILPAAHGLAAVYSGSGVRSSPKAVGKPKSPQGTARARGGITKAVSRNRSRTGIAPGPLDSLLSKSKSESPRPKAGPGLGLQACLNCGTTNTPLWRGGPEGPKTLCNACGVRYMKTNKRPKERLP